MSEYSKKLPREPRELAREFAKDGRAGEYSAWRSDGKKMLVARQVAPLYFYGRRAAAYLNQKMHPSCRSGVF